MLRVHTKPKSSQIPKAYSKNTQFFKMKSLQETHKLYFTSGSKLTDLAKPPGMISYFEHLKDSKKYLEKPSYVWLADKNRATKKVNIDEIERTHQFTWIEDILVEDTEKDTQNSLNNTATVKLRNYLNNVESYHSKMSLLDMADLGFGVIANEEFKLHSEEVITFYAGMVLNPLYREYIMRSEYIFDARINWKPAFLDAKFLGNISRYMPHLPKPSELIPEKLPGIPLNEIATENVCAKSDGLAGDSIPLMHKRKGAEIQPGDVMGFSYGAGYWKHRSFWLVNKTGNKIAEVKYDSDQQLVKK